MANQTIFTAKNNVLYKKYHGFTLIELLVVIAIISIFSGIVYSGILRAKNAALIAKSRMQFIKYESAINSYRIEYGELPEFLKNEIVFDLSRATNVSLFIKTLSGRNVDGSALSDVDLNLNKKRIEFCDFSDSDFYKNANGTVDRTKIADALNNTTIYVIAEDNLDDDFTIPAAKFHECVRKFVPSDGLRKQVAIYSIIDNGDVVIFNWQQ